MQVLKTLGNVMDLQKRACLVVLLQGKRKTYKWFTWPQRILVQELPDVTIGHPWRDNTELFHVPIWKIDSIKGFDIGVMKV